MSFKKVTYCVECLVEGKQNKYVVNKTHELCNTHNQLRLSKISSSKIIKSNPFPIKTERQKNKEEFYLKYDSEVEHICTGCLNHSNLSHSHLIPVSKRIDLECSKPNVKFHCLVRVDNSEGCHSRWESNNPEKMNTLLDYKENMDYIKTVDLHYYNYIISKNGI